MRPKPIEQAIKWGIKNNIMLSSAQDDFIVFSHKFPEGEYRFKFRIHIIEPKLKMIGLNVDQTYINPN